MKKLKSHFWYTKNQRNGILLLLFLILCGQLIYTYIDFSSNDSHLEDNLDVLAFQNRIDSLKLIEKDKRRPKLYPFNPNYITDFKGYQLGMSIDEIERLIRFREQDKFVNSAKEFQTVTKISDSLLHTISPYFKFPDWVLAKQKRLAKKQVERLQKEKRVISTSDINLATKKDFETIHGIGEKLSARIVNYRAKLQGFSLLDQVDEIWGLPEEVVVLIKERFKIITVPKIRKIDINTATFKEVLEVPYIDYKLCKKIFEFRDEVAELQDISELKNIKDFPLDKYDRITLYLNSK